MRESTAADILEGAPPRSFFGFHQIRDASQSPRDIARAAWRFRDRRLPCDCIVFPGQPAADDLRWSAAVRERLGRDLAELRYSTHGLASSFPFPVPEFLEPGGAGIEPFVERIARAPWAVASPIDARRHPDGASMVRAIEESLFMPFLCARLKAGDGERELWTFGTEWESRVRQLLDLRMQLLPAFATIAFETGTLPIARIDGDPFALRLGDDLLLAPVRDTTEEQRRVMLPEGDWYHYWSHRHCPGGRPADVVAQHGHPPIFVRAGAILPTDPVRQHSAEAIPHATFLDIYAADDMRGLLVEQGPAGVRARTEFRAAMSYGMLSLAIDPAPSPWRPDRLMWSVRVHGLGGSVRGARIDGQAVEFGRSSRVVEISFRATGERQVLEVEFAEY